MRKISTQEKKIRYVMLHWYHIESRVKVSDLCLVLDDSIPIHRHNFVQYQNTPYIHVFRIRSCDDKIDFSMRRLYIFDGKQKAILKDK